MELIAAAVLAAPLGFCAGRGRGLALYALACALGLAVHHAATRRGWELDAAVLALGAAACVLGAQVRVVRRLALSAPRRRH